MRDVVINWYIRPDKGYTAYILERTDKKVNYTPIFSFKANTGIEIEQILASLRQKAAREKWNVIETREVYV